MARFLMKAAPENDLYVVWSESVDNAVAVLTRREVKASGVWGEDQIRRADATGTSHLDGDGSWSCGALLVANALTRRGSFELQRDRLAEYARWLRQGATAAAEDLLSVVP